MLSKIHIKQFAKVSSGQGAPQRETDFSDDGIPFIRAGSLEDLLNGKKETELPKVNEAIAREYKLKLYQPNTIVFAKSGMSSLKGRIYKLKNPCYVVNHLATLELFDGAIPDYVVYTLRYFSPVKLINDNAYPSLKQSVIENFEIPFPKDKKVQLHIANLLSKAENLIAQRKESIRLLDEFLKSTFLEMFGDPVRNEKGFKKCRFGDFINEIVAGSSYGGEQKEFLKDDEFGVLKVSAVTWGIFKPKEFKVINKRDIKGEIVHPSKGDLLFSRANTRELVGATCIVDNDYPKLFLPDKLWNLKLNEIELNKVFVHFLFQNKTFKNTLTREASGTSGSMLNISMEKLRNVKFPKPPIELQTQFAQIVEKTEVLKAQYQQSLQELENLYGSLSQKAFRGELSIKDDSLLMAVEPVRSMAVEPEITYNKK